MLFTFDSARELQRLARTVPNESLNPTVTSRGAAAMTTLLEINPKACIIVAGPQITSSCLSPTYRELKLSYWSLISDGIERALQLCSDDQERGRLLQSQPDSLDAASREMASILSRHGALGAWMQDTFVTATHKIRTAHQTPLVQLMQTMQENDCRLVYTHYDSWLDTIFHTKPVLLANTAQLEGWIDGKEKGFLHIHGLFSEPGSVILHCQAQNFSQLPSFCKLKELFRKRTIIFVGHETNHLSPLLANIAHIFLQDENSIKNPPLFMSSTLGHLPSCFLHLPILPHEESVLHELMVIGAEGNFSVGKLTITIPACTGGLLRIGWLHSWHDVR